LRITSFDCGFPASKLIDMPLTNITMSRTLRGSTQDRGELRVSITNHLENDSRVLFMEAMPRHLHFYLHTLHINSGGIPRGQCHVTMNNSCLNHPL
jgi:hypothetical protein